MLQGFSGNRVKTFLFTQNTDESLNPCWGESVSRSSLSYGMYSLIFFFLLAVQTAVNGTTVARFQRNSRWCCTFYEADSFSPLLPLLSLLFFFTSSSSSSNFSYSSSSNSSYFFFFFSFSSFFCSSFPLSPPLPPPLHLRICCISSYSSSYCPPPPLLVLLSSPARTVGLTVFMNMRPLSQRRVGMS